MAEFPAFPLWTDAYLGDTTHLTTIEHGAYLLLLMAMWRAKENRLPNDDRVLARYARLTSGQWARMKPVLMKFFDIDNDGITQGRLTDEAEAVRRNSKKQSNNSRARWLKNKKTDDATALPDESQQDAPLPLPITTPNVGSGGGGTREPIGAIPNDGTEAATATTRFLALRAELWPSEPNFPAPTLTLQTQVAEFLKEAPLALVIEVVERGMRSAIEQGQSAPHSFRAFHRSLTSAIANHKRAATVAAEGAANGYQPRPQQTSRVADVETRRRRTAESVRRVMATH